MAWGCFVVGFGAYLNACYCLRMRLLFLGGGGGVQDMGLSPGCLRGLYSYMFFF